MIFSAEWFSSNHFTKITFFRVQLTKILGFFLRSFDEKHVFPAILWLHSGFYTDMFSWGFCAVLRNSRLFPFFEKNCTFFAILWWKLHWFSDHFTKLAFFSVINWYNIIFRYLSKKIACLIRILSGNPYCFPHRLKISRFLSIYFNENHIFPWSFHKMSNFLSKC